MIKSVAVQRAGPHRVVSYAENGQPRTRVGVIRIGTGYVSEKY